MAMLRVFVKKTVRLDRMNPSQQQMFKIGQVAVASVKDRVRRALTPDLTPSKKLSKRWAVIKTRWARSIPSIRLPARRDLSFSGQMLRDFQVRTVSETKFQARNSTRRGRDKAAGNERREQWAAYSREDEKRVQKAARQLLPAIAGRMVIAYSRGSLTGPRGTVKL